MPRPPKLHSLFLCTLLLGAVPVRAEDSCLRYLSSTDNVAKSTREAAYQEITRRDHTALTTEMRDVYRKQFGIEFKHAKLNDVEATAVLGYSYDYFFHINRELRASPPSPSAIFVARDVVSGLAKLPVFRGSVYRRTNLPPDVLALYTPGAVVRMKAFTSTTHSHEALGYYGGDVIYEIASLSGRNLESATIFPKEKEILFPPGALFRVESVHKETRFGVPSTILRLQEIEQIDQPVLDSKWKPFLVSPRMPATDGKPNPRVQSRILRESETPPEACRNSAASKRVCSDAT